MRNVKFENHHPNDIVPQDWKMNPAFEYLERVENLKDGDIVFAEQYHGHRPISKNEDGSLRTFDLTTLRWHEVRDFRQSPRDSFLYEWKAVYFDGTEASRTFGVGHSFFVKKNYQPTIDDIIDVLIGEQGLYLAP